MSRALQRIFTLWLLAGILVFTAVGCSKNIHRSDGYFSPPQPFSTGYSSGLFTVVGFTGDEDTVRDITVNLVELSKQICSDLHAVCDWAVKVELFPDQATFDRLGMNPEMQGYYAYSGEGRIQMVTPRQEIPGIETDYGQRVFIAVHEFAHLVNDEINPNMPVWLDEGVAVAVVPHTAYDFVKNHRFPFELVPAFDEIEKSYQSVPAADLFAFSLVDFIIAEYGQDILNDLIREPDSFDRVLGVSRSSFEQGWRDFLNQNYRND